MDEIASGSLAEQVATLRSRVGLLEQALRSYGIVVGEGVEQDAGQVLAPPPPTLPLPQAAAPIQVDTAFFSGAVPSLPRFSPQAEERSLESRIGSQWFNRIGILAVLVGMSWFLKLAIDNHWIGPLGRVVIGLIAGAGLVTWSERFQRRGYPAFSYSLKAAFFTCRCGRPSRFSTSSPLVQPLPPWLRSPLSMRSYPGVTIQNC